MLKKLNFDIIKKLSVIKGEKFMNLHEKCLLRYLQNPDELSYSTEILKLNNFILEKQFILKNLSINSDLISSLKQ